MCLFCNNPTSLKLSKIHSETIINYKDGFYFSSDDDFYEKHRIGRCIPPDDEIVSLEVVDIVDPEINPLHLPNFNLEEISSGSPTTHSELSLPDYKAFYVDNDHFKEKSSGSTTTHVDFSQYDSFIFDLSNDQFPPADRSDLYHEEFADELTHIMSLPELECFKFKIEPDPGDLTSIDLGIRKNASTTNVNVHLRMDQIFFLLLLYGSFLLFSRIPLSLHIFSPPGMKTSFLIPAF
ncbi:hypothetical protein Tco_0088699 [Tanacetum coccineum]